MPFCSTFAPKRTATCQARTVVLSASSVCRLAALVVGAVLLVLCSCRACISCWLCASKALSGCNCCCSTASINACIWSQQLSSTCTSSGLSATSPLRTSSSKLSATCVNATMASRPNKPAEPLIVCAARKMALMMSSDAACWRTRNKQSSISASSSRLSSMKV